MSFVAWGFRKDKIIYQEFHTLEFSPGYAALLVSVCVCEGGGAKRTLQWHLDLGGAS